MKKRMLLTIILSVFVIGIVFPVTTMSVSAQQRIVLKSGWKITRGRAYPGVPYHAKNPKKSAILWKTPTVSKHSNLNKYPYETWNVVDVWVLQKGSKKRVYYQVDGQHNTGWVWRGYLTKGYNPNESKGNNPNQLPEDN